MGSESAAAMRFAFAGIDFLSDVLDALLGEGWTLVKLFTRPCDGVYDTNDIVTARARDLKAPIQLSRITTGDLARLNGLECDALVVAGYPWLVREWQEHVPYGFNVHPSPLPMGRGPYPLFRAILSDQTIWGVTAHVLDPSFDTGAILGQEIFPLTPDETHDSLLAKCQMASSRLSRRLAHGLPRAWAEAQPQGEGSYWPRISDPERTIDWTGTVAEVMRVIRALGSIETIGTISGKQFYVRAATGWTEAHGYAPGTLAHAYRRHLVVAVRDGFVQVTGWRPVGGTTYVWNGDQ
jgi:methionyl-tRNA formyltransferase